MEALRDWNIILFHFFNAAGPPTPAILGITEFVAQNSPYLALGMLALIWFLGGPAHRRAIMMSGVALVLGLAANFTIATAIYVPRPFEAGIGQSFLAHSLETSFPSDHATFLWSIGFALLIAPPLRWAGLIISVLGIATAWARVFLGVHFPLDMAGSLLISLAAALIASRSDRLLSRILFQSIEDLYVKIAAAVTLRPNSPD